MKDIAIAVSSAALGALMAFYYLNLTDKVNKKEKQNLPRELIDEFLSRNSKFTDITPLETALVVVVGVGGVGSNCVHSLARSGVRRIRIVDFDLLTLSSLNRHAVGTLNDVGHSKCKVLKQHLLEICPFVEIEIINKLYDTESCDEVLSGDISYVVDCIDNKDTKLHLIETCLDRNIPIISSMGAGGKCDASKVKIADISETVADPLSKAIRQKLKKRGIYRLDVIFSTELNSTGLEEFSPDTSLDEIKDLSVVPNFRCRILPVLGPLPAMFGNALSLFVLSKLCNLEFEPIPKRFQKSTLNKLYNEILKEERKKTNNQTYITFNDFVYLYEEVFCCRSIISGQSTSLFLSRLNLDLPLSFTNAILVTRKEKQQYEKGLLEVSAAIKQRVELKLNKLKSCY
eukprot:NODE_644_length_5619_cov_0.132790.p1 type:complete len:401 gc:universal NODE_644_length_5619_cov_0.132790:3369-2167(-)